MFELDRDTTVREAAPGRFEAVTLDFPCSPCRQRFFRECRPAASGRPFCLHDIEPDRVLAAADRILGPPDR